MQVINATPQPIPGKVSPAIDPPATWVGKDLVAADSVLVSPTTGNLIPQGTAYRTEFQNEFTKLDAASFTDAVEAASKLSAANTIPVRGEGANSISLAMAVLQSADGAYYVSELDGYRATGRDSYGGYLSIDTHNSSWRIGEVQRLHPAVKAVVGAYNYVNFTGEKIEPTLAG